MRALAPGSRSRSNSSSALRLLDLDSDDELFVALLVRRSRLGDMDAPLEFARERDTLPPKSLCVASSRSDSELHQGQCSVRVSQPWRRIRSEQLERLVSGLHGLMSVYQRCEQGCMATFKFATHMIEVVLLELSQEL